MGGIMINWWPLRPSPFLCDLSFQNWFFFLTDVMWGEKASIIKIHLSNDLNSHKSLLLSTQQWLLRRISLHNLEGRPISIFRLSPKEFRLTGSNKYIKSECSGIGKIIDLKQSDIPPQTLPNSQPLLHHIPHNRNPGLHRKRNEVQMHLCLIQTKGACNLSLYK